MPKLRDCTQRSGSGGEIPRNYFFTRGNKHRMNSNSKAKTTKVVSQDLQDFDSELVLIGRHLCQPGDDCGQHAESRLNVFFGVVPPN